MIFHFQIKAPLRITYQKGDTEQEHPVNFASPGSVCVLCILNLAVRIGIANALESTFVLLRSILFLYFCDH